MRRTVDAFVNRGGESACAEQLPDLHNSLKRHSCFPKAPLHEDSPRPPGAHVSYRDETPRLRRALPA